MSARIYQNILKKFRDRCAKLGVANISIKKSSKTSFVIKGVNWTDAIEVDKEILENIILAGYFRLETEIDSLEINKEEKIIVNEFILFKKYSKKGVLTMLPKLSLFGGVIILIMSLVMYILNINTVGHFDYTYEGNFPAFNSLNWFQMFLIGLFLVLASFFFRWMEKHNN